MYLSIFLYFGRTGEQRGCHGSCVRKLFGCPFIRGKFRDIRQPPARHDKHRLKEEDTGKHLQRHEHQGVTADHMAHLVRQQALEFCFRQVVEGPVRQADFTPGQADRAFDIARPAQVRHMACVNLRADFPKGFVGFMFGGHTGAAAEVLDRQPVSPGKGTGGEECKHTPQNGCQLFGTQVRNTLKETRARYILAVGLGHHWLGAGDIMCHGLVHWGRLGRRCGPDQVF